MLEHRLHPPHISPPHPLPQHHHLRLHIRQHLLRVVNLQTVTNLRRVKNTAVTFLPKRLLQRLPPVNLPRAPVVILPRTHRRLLPPHPNPSPPRVKRHPLRRAKAQRLPKTSRDMRVVIKDCSTLQRHVLQTAVVCGPTTWTTISKETCFVREAWTSSKSSRSVIGV
jgi:hypothetical protein